jgi:hypothetical protein
VNASLQDDGLLESPFREMRAEPKSPIFIATLEFARKTMCIIEVLTLQMGYFGNSCGSGLVMKTNCVSVDCT